MKAVLISVQPKWCQLIASGKKTVEVRKTRPKIDVPFKCYIYMTKAKETGYLSEWLTAYETPHGIENGKQKAIGEFICDSIITDKSFGHNVLFKTEACMSDADISAYCLNKEMYCWHISDLAIYDKPKELSEFFKVGHSEYCKSEWEEREELRVHLEKHNEITGDKAHLNTDSDFENILKMLSPFKMKRPPQSWCYVEGGMQV